MGIIERDVTACNGSVLIPADERCNNLEYTNAPEYVPGTWIGPHVGLRLVQAFKTLVLMPGLRLNSASGYWPGYRHDWADLMAQLSAGADVRDLINREANRARVMPSAQDVGRMEAAIAWPARYLSTRPIVMRMVQQVAAWRAKEVETDTIARRLKKNPTHLRRVNRNGLDTIASGLRRDSIAVF